MSQTLAVVLMLAAAAAGPDEDWSRFRGPNGSGVAETGALPADFGPTRTSSGRPTCRSGIRRRSLTERSHLPDRGSAMAGLSDCPRSADRQDLWERPAPRPRPEKLDTRTARPGPVRRGRRRTTSTSSSPTSGLLAYTGRQGALARAARPVQQHLRHGRIAGRSSTTWSSWSATRAPLLHRRARQEERRGRWKTPRPEARSGHSTPILYQPQGGRTQILAPGSFQLTAYDAETGAKLWWVGGLSFELKSTPVVSGDALFINGFGSPENQPGRSEDSAASTEVVAAYDKMPTRTAADP